MKRLLQALFIVLVLSAWGQALWQHAHLPERVAAHFNRAGDANGWMSRNAQLGWQIGTVTFVAVLLQGIVLLQSRLPVESINVPNRNYWFAPERRAASDGWISGLVYSLGSLVQLFLIAVFHHVYRANLAATPQLSPTFRPLSIFLLLAIAGLVAFTILRFARRPAARP
jgi:serine/threonine-protein kinase